MTETATKTVQVFRPNAGICEKCGNAKTWDFKVLNANSGKKMPGHIDAQGHVLGDGNCPFWSGVAKKNAEKKASTNKPKPAESAPAVVRTALSNDIEQATPYHAVLSTTPSPQPFHAGPAAPVEIDAVAENSHVTITIGAMAFSLPRETVAELARKLVAIFTA
jgi:hypothetical protein